MADIDRRIIADAPVAEAPVAEAPAGEATADVPVAEAPVADQAFEQTIDEPPTTQYVPPAPPPDPEIDFSQSEKPQKTEPEVKTVKVRSSVDVMAELEALRKRATNAPPKAARRDVLADLESLRPKRDLQRTLHLKVPQDVLARTKSVRVTLSFEDTDQGVIDSQDQTVDLTDASEVQNLSVNIKIDMA